MTPAPGMKIAGVASAVPPAVTLNSDIEDRLGLERGWIVRRTGILCRPTAPASQATSDLAIEAGRAALKNAGVAPSEIGLLLLATSTPDHLLPPTAPLVAHRLELSNAGAIDITGACSGFLYALAMGNWSGAAMRKPVLIVGANILSRRVDDRDPGTMALFGDGAGAVVLVPCGQPHVLGSHLGADGSCYAAIQIPAGGTREPLTVEGLTERRNLIRIEDGRSAFKQAVKMMAEAGRLALDEAGLTVADVAWWVPHQANRRIIEECGNALGIAPCRTVIVIDRFANSSAATIPIALTEAAGSGRIRPGEILLLTSAGAGMISAGVVLRL